MFAFCWCNGNIGDVQLFETQAEAERAASLDWGHLTPRERDDYDQENGGYFAVVEGEDIDSGRLITSWTDTVYRLLMTDGSEGTDTTFDEYADALDAGKSAWDALSDKKKRELMEDRDDGSAWCIIEGRPYDNDRDEVVKDWLEEYDELLWAEMTGYKHAIEERMVGLVSDYGLSRREVEVVVLTDLGKGPQEIADILGLLTGSSMSRQSISVTLRRARTKMTIDTE